MRRLAWVAVVIGTLLVAGGLYAGFQTVKRDGLVCGEGFHSYRYGPYPDPSSDEEGTFYSDGKGDAECASSLSTHRIAAVSVAIPGAVIALAGAVTIVRRTRG